MGCICACFLSYFLFLCLFFWRSVVIVRQWAGRWVARCRVLGHSTIFFSRSLMARDPCLDTVISIFWVQRSLRCSLQAAVVAAL